MTEPNSENKEWLKSHQHSATQRRFVEASPELAEKVRLYCFLKNITMKDFVNETLQKALEPYDHWLENLKILRGEKPSPSR